jgi:hypothetical protein
MRIDSQLAKLEQRAKRALRCAWCLYILHDIPPTEQKQYKADPQSHGSAKCPYCGTTFTVNLSGLDQYEREANMLCYLHEWGGQYRDERFYAAGVWMTHRRIIKGWQAGELSEEKSEARQRRMQARRNEKNKGNRRARERAEVKERALSFLQRMNEKEEKEFAPHSFPLAAEIEAMKEPDSFGFIPGTYKKMVYDENVAHRMLYRVSVMEACERVLWGKVLPQTKAVKGELDAVIQRCEAERAQKEREAEEEKARRDAERERERLERLAATVKPTNSQMQPPVQPSPVWLDNGTIGSQQRGTQNRNRHPFEDD